LPAVIKQSQLDSKDGQIRVLIDHSRGGGWLLTVNVTPPPPLPLGSLGGG
jgi:hypothetical protein